MGAVLAMKVWTGSLALALAVMLGGCDSYRGGGGVGQLVVDGVKGLRAPEPKPAPPPTAEELAAIPVSVLQAGVESRGTSARLVQVAENRGHRTWIAADGVSVTLRDGVLTETRGLGEDLISADVTQTLDLLNGSFRREAVRVHRYLDGEGHLYVISYLCEITGREADNVTIVGRRIAAERITESCYSARGAQFENVYWRGRDGRIVAGRHWVGPKTGYLRTRLLKP